MTFGWLSELLKNFDIPTKIAWMALLFGLGAFAFLLYDLLPAGELITQTAAWLLSWLGIVVLVVKAGFGVRDMVAARLAVSKANIELDRVEAVRIANIEANLLTLNTLELGQLMWIMRGGIQRVDVPHLQHGLFSKKIVRQIIPHNMSLAEVDDHVWSKRDAYKDRFPALTPHMPISTMDSVKISNDLSKLYKMVKNGN